MSEPTHIIRPGTVWVRTQGPYRGSRQLVVSVGGDRVVAWCEQVRDAPASFTGTVSDFLLHFHPQKPNPST